MFTRTHLAAVMAGTAIVGLSYYAKTTIGRRASGCRIIGKFIDPLMKGARRSMTEFEFEDTSCWLPDVLLSAKTLKTISQLPVDKTDVFVASFPKSGTTWLQEIVFLVHSDLDFEKSADQNLDQRFPFIELGVHVVTESASPRLIKSHLPYEFMPKDLKQGNGKVVYIARNPRDVCVSFFHFASFRTTFDFKGSLNDFFERFISGKVMSGDWATNVLSYWRRRHQANVLFVTYEELTKDPMAVVQNIATFLEKNLDQAQLQKIVDHCSFNAMRMNPSTNWSWLDDNGIALKNHETEFFRKGEVGDWVNYFDAKMCEDMDKACGDKVKAEGLEFVYKL